jgi:hypothetical protein
MHPDISPADLANAKPVRVLPESSAPQLPLGWDQAPVASAPPRTANPRRLPAAVRRTVAASDAPAGSLDNFRILDFNHSSKAKYPSNSRDTRSTEVRSEISESEHSDEELSDGPSTPYSSPSPDATEIVTPVYHMTTEYIQLPVDFSSSKMQFAFGEMDVKAEPLTWTWDQLTAASATDYTKAIFTDDAPAQDVFVGSLFENYDYDMFGQGQVERPVPELIPGFETTAELFGWDLGSDKSFCPGTMAGTASGLSIPDDVHYNPAPSPKLSDFAIAYEDSPSPVISASQGETFIFSPADYSMASSGDALDELFFNSFDSGSWNQLSSADWEELSQFQASS